MAKAMKQKKGGVNPHTKQGYGGGVNEGLVIIGGSLVVSRLILITIDIDEDWD